MSNFLGYSNITLQPSSVKNTYSFLFPAAISQTAKGSLPYDTTISSATVKAYNSNDVEVADMIISNFITEETNTITVFLSYPIEGKGDYILEFVLTLSDSSVWVKRFDRVICEDD